MTIPALPPNRAPDSQATRGDNLVLLGDGVRRLPCTLTEEEREAAAERHRALDIEIEEQEEALKQHSHEWRKKIERLKGEKRAARTAARTGTENREIGTCLQYDHYQDRVIETRTDTGTIVETRKPSTAERERAEGIRQGSLFSTRQH